MVRCHACAVHEIDAAPRPLQSRVLCGSSYQYWSPADVGHFTEYWTFPVYFVSAVRKSTLYIAEKNVSTPVRHHCLELNMLHGQWLCKWVGGEFTLFHCRRSDWGYRVTHFPTIQLNNYTAKKYRSSFVNCLVNADVSKLGFEVSFRRDLSVGVGRSTHAMLLLLYNIIRYRLIF